MAYRTLLLLVLTVVIVALAVMAGIFAFAEGAAKNRQDMIVARGIELASFSQEWSMKPGMFGGGNGSFEGVDIWKVSGHSGTGGWMEENDTRYLVEQLDQPNHARLIAEDFQLDSRIVIHFDATSIISTDFGTGGVIFIDPDSE